MVDIKQATDKLKKIVAGATLMAGIAMGTGCDTPQETRRVPTEDVVDDDDKNIISDQDNNNITDDTDGKPSENNDDKSVEHNDNDNNPIENEDKDTPITDNDNPVNDDDPIENNDNDGEPTEINDNDTQSYECALENILATPEELTNHSQEEIQSAINYYHDQNRSQCHGSVSEKEKFDTKGNLCIEDECNIEPNDIAQEAGTVWIDNLPFLAGELFSGDLSQMGDIVYYRKIEKLNKGNPTDLTITRKFMTFYIKDVPTTSCFQPNNIVEDASTITMVPTNIGDRGCYADEQSILPDDTISTKNIQPKITSSDFEKACKNVSNSQFSQKYKKCSTTITEFAWLENVVPYLNSKSGLGWNSTRIINTKIEKDVNNNIFRMYFSVDGGQHSWVVELPNAKRCLDECYGIEGCEVSIKPSPDISNGCKVKEPENASLTRPNVKAKKQNLPLTNQKKQARVINMPKAKRPNLATLRVAQLARRYTR